MLFSFLLPLTLLLTAPAQGPAKAPAPAKVTLGWLPDRPLTWADFQARPGITVRFDVISVLWLPGGVPELTHFAGAF